jgi:hypothetical protein
VLFMRPLLVTSKNRLAFQPGGGEPRIGTKGNAHGAIKYFIAAAQSCLPALRLSGREFTRLRLVS